MPDKLIEMAREQFKEVEETTREWRKNAEDDLSFAHGEQWPDQIKAWRESQNLPVLTIDRLEGPISQLVGDQRQNDLAVKVVCKDTQSRKIQTVDQKQMDEAEFTSGLVRDIQRRSRFEWVQAQAFESAVVCGLGGWYIETEYESAESFDQNLVIRRIPNPLAIYPDAKNWASTKGMDFAFVVDHMSQDSFKKAYPKASGSFDTADDWASDQVRVAIWWQRTYVDDVLLQLRLVDGDLTTILKSRLGDAPLPAGARLVQERKTQTEKVVRRTITGLEVLEETEWVGRYIPVVLVTGKETWLKGKLDWMGMVRKAKDPQRLYNYNRSSVAEIMGAAPRVPWILTAEQVSGYEQMWSTANVGNKPYLLINPDPKAPGWPHRNQIEYPAGFSQEAVIAANDIMSTTKIHEASLGQRSNETSGIAIQARQREGDTGNYVYTDQLLLAVEETGRILVDAIPRVYDSTRLVTSRARDGSTSLVQLNNPMPGQVMNHLSGKYDTEVTAGPAFGTARQESVQAMTALAQAAPQLLQVGADIWVGNMDWPGADELAARLKKMVPPNLLSEEEQQEDPALMLAQMQQAMQQMQGMLGQTQEAAQQAAEELRKAQMEKMGDQGEIERLRINLEQANAELSITKQAAKLAVDTLSAKLKQTEDYQQAADALRQSVPPPTPAPQQDVDLKPVLDAIQNITKAMPSQSQQPVQVIVETGEKPKVKTGRAVKQADGSWVMESTETEKKEE